MKILCSRYFINDKFIAYSIGGGLKSLFPKSVGGYLPKLGRKLTVQRKMADLRLENNQQEYIHTCN